MPQSESVRVRDIRHLEKVKKIFEEGLEFETSRSQVIEAGLQALETRLTEHRYSGERIAEELLKAFFRAEHPDEKKIDVWIRPHGDGGHEAVVMIGEKTEKFTLGYSYEEKEPEK